VRVSKGTLVVPIAFKRTAKLARVSSIPMAARDATPPPPPPIAVIRQPPPDAGPPDAAIDSCDGHLAERDAFIPTANSRLRGATFAGEGVCHYELSLRMTGRSAADCVDALTDWLTGDGIREKLRALRFGAIICKDGHTEYRIEL
jgi:hypothetical protein